MRWTPVVVFLILAFAGLFYYHHLTTLPGLDLNKIKAFQLSGEEYDWQELQGKKTILSMGASWCGNCIVELDQLKELQSTLLNDVQVIVISDEPVEKIIRFRDKRRYPFLFLRSSTSFSKMGIHSIPANYLLNSRAEVVKEQAGSFNWEDPSTAEHLLKIMSN